MNTCVPNGDIIQHIYSFSHDDGRLLMRVKEFEMKDGEILTDSINTREEVYVSSDLSDPLSKSIPINVNGMQYNTIENSRLLYKHLLKKGFQPVSTYPEVIKVKAWIKES
jgi:hypothetical protein